MEKTIAIHQMKAEDGSLYRVHEIQQYIDASSYEGKEWIEGLKRLQLSDGRACNHIDDDTFEIVVTGQIIRRA